MSDVLCIPLAKCVLMSVNNFFYWGLEPVIIGSEWKVARVDPLHWVVEQINVRIRDVTVRNLLHDELRKRSGPSFSIQPRLWNCR